MNAQPFVLLDVFTNTPLTGNPLRVFTEADGLDDLAMQGLAREFNSETTFVVSPRDPRATRRLRSFSPEAEVFGAGDNALGAWWAIIVGGHVPVPESGTVWQELGERVLPVEVTFESGALTRITMTQSTPSESSATLDSVSLARALSTDPDALTVPGLEPCVVFTGATTHLLVPIRRLADLAGVRIDAGRLMSLVKPFRCEGCYCYCLETLEGTSIAHARGFFPGIGVAEDPATASAAGPLGGHLVTRGLAPRDEWFTIEQGDEINRPARITVRIVGGQIHVGGACAVVGSGTMTLADLRV